MRVYLCVNRGLGLQILSGKVAKEISAHPEIANVLLGYTVYTQKKKALKEYANNTRKYIRDRLKEKIDREPIILFLLDVKDNYLTYLSGDELDPYISEYYPERMNTAFSLSIKRIKCDDILSMETWVYFLDKNKRLKCKRAFTLTPRIW